MVDVVIIGGGICGCALLYELSRYKVSAVHESFSLLKDASATAIYGNRGANGVWRQCSTTEATRKNSPS